MLSAAPSISCNLNLNADFHADVQRVQNRIPNPNAIVELLQQECSTWNRIKAFIKHKPSALSLLNQLSSEDLKVVLQKVAQCSVETNNSKLIQRCLDLITLDRLQPVVQTLLKDDFGTTIKCLEVCEKSLKSEVNHPSHKPISAFKRLLSRFIDTLLAAFSFFSIGSEPSTTWEASQIISVYCKVLAIPFLMLSTLTALLLPPLTAVWVTVLTVVVVAAAIFAYIKWLRPFPEQICRFEQFSNAEALKSSLPFMNREKPLNDVVANIRMKLNVILVGKPGTGKTSLCKELGRRIAAGEIEDDLKCKKMIGGNVARLLPKPFSPEGAREFSRLLDSIKNYAKDTFIVLDDLQHAVKNDGLWGEVLDETGKSAEGDAPRPVFIGITTPEGYQALLAKASNPIEFTRRFPGIVYLDATSKEETISIIQEVAQRSSPEVTIAEGALEEIVEMTSKELSEMAQPDISIKILQKTLSHVEMNPWNTSVKEQVIQAEKGYRKLIQEFQKALGTESQKECSQKLLEQKEIYEKVNAKLAMEANLRNKLMSVIESRKYYEGELQSLELNMIKGMKKNQSIEDIKKRFLYSTCFIKPIIQETIQGLKQQIGEFEGHAKENASPAYVLTSSIVKEMVAQEVEIRNKAKVS